MLRGDQSEAARWLPFARQHLNTLMLAVSIGAAKVLTKVLTPPGVTIRLRAAALDSLIDIEATAAGDMPLVLRFLPWAITTNINPGDELTQGVKGHSFSVGAVVINDPWLRVPDGSAYPISVTGSVDLYVDAAPDYICAGYTFDEQSVTLSDGVPAPAFSTSSRAMGWKCPRLPKDRQPTGAEIVAATAEGGAAYSAENIISHLRALAEDKQIGEFMYAYSWFYNTMYPGATYCYLDNSGQDTIVGKPWTTPRQPDESTLVLIYPETYDEERSLLLEYYSDDELYDGESRLDIGSIISRTEYWTPTFGSVRNAAPAFTNCTGLIVEDDDVYGVFILIRQVSSERKLADGLTSYTFSSVTWRVTDLDLLVIPLLTWFRVTPTVRDPNSDTSESPSAIALHAPPGTRYWVKTLPMTGALVENETLYTWTLNTGYQWHDTVGDEWHFSHYNRKTMPGGLFTQPAPTRDKEYWRHFRVETGSRESDHVSDNNGWFGVVASEVYESLLSNDFPAEIVDLGTADRLHGIGRRPIARYEVRLEAPPQPQYVGSGWQYSQPESYFDASVVYEFIALSEELQTLCPTTQMPALPDSYSWYIGNFSSSNGHRTATGITGSHIFICRPYNAVTLTWFNPDDLWSIEIWINSVLVYSADDLADPPIPYLDYLFESSGVRAFWNSPRAEWRLFSDNMPDVESVWYRRDGDSRPLLEVVNGFYGEDALSQDISNLGYETIWVSMPVNPIPLTIPHLKLAFGYNPSGENFLCLVNAQTGEALYNNFASSRFIQTLAALDDELWMPSYFDAAFHSFGSGYRRVVTRNPSVYVLPSTLLGG